MPSRVVRARQARSPSADDAASWRVVSQVVTILGLFLGLAAIYCGRLIIAPRCVTQRQPGPPAGHRRRLPRGLPRRRLRSATRRTRPQRRTPCRPYGGALGRTARGLRCPDRGPLPTRPRRRRQTATVDGAAAVWAPGGRPVVVFTFTIAHGRLSTIELVADTERIQDLDLTILGDSTAS